MKYRFVLQSGYLFIPEEFKNECKAESLIDKFTYCIDHWPDKNLLI